MTDEKTIQLTEEELQKKIDEAVNKKVAETTETLKKQHNEEMAQQRIKLKDEKEQAVKKATEDAKLSAEDLAKKQIEEERKAEQEELAQLRYEKKVNDRANKLKGAGLPDFFKNDTRLLSAEDDKVDEVIEVIKKEYESILPDGAKVDTNLAGGKGTTDKFSSFRKLGVSK